MGHYLDRFMRVSKCCCTYCSVLNIGEVYLKWASSLENYKNQVLDRDYTGTFSVLLNKLNYLSILFYQDQQISHVYN